MKNITAKSKNSVFGQYLAGTLHQTLLHAITMKTENYKASQIPFMSTRILD
jgi:hypothetical protein